MDAEKLCHVLTATFSKNPADRKSAEEQLQAAKQEVGFVANLVNLTTLEGLGNEVQQSAAITFKNIVKDRWEDMAEEEKAHLRGVVIGLMVKGTPSVRDTLSAAVQIIATHDFPSKWGDFVQVLAQQVNPADMNATKGALMTAHAVFQRYRDIESLTEDQKNEILMAIDKFGNPMQDLMKIAVVVITKPDLGREEGLMALEVAGYLVDLFLDFNYTDIGQFFFDNLQFWMESGFYTCLTCNLPQAVSQTGEPGPYEKAKALVLGCVTVVMERHDEDLERWVKPFTDGVLKLLEETTGAINETRNDDIAEEAMAYMSALCRTVHHKVIDKEKVQTIFQSVIQPNVQLRASDLEAFEGDSAEFIRRDIEGGDYGSRRSSACDLVRNLARHYPETKDYFSAYIHHLIEEYGKDQGKNWTHKDTALFITMSLLPKSSASPSPTAVVTNPLKDIVILEEFMQKYVLPDLENGHNKSKEEKQNMQLSERVIKADCIKFVTAFRERLPQGGLLHVLPWIIGWMDAECEVVSTYAFSAVNLILPKMDSFEQWKAFTPTLMTKCASHLVDSVTQQSPNEHTAKAFYRVISCAKGGLTEFLQQFDLCPHLINVISQIYKNPQNPIFNHYVFESLAGLVRHNPSRMASMGEPLVGMCEGILTSDAQEFTPYVFQLLALMLHSMQGGITDFYAKLFRILTTEEGKPLYQNKGNIPAIIQLLRVFISKPGATEREEVISGVVWVYRLLIFSKVHDHDALRLLNTFWKRAPVERILSVGKDLVGPQMQRLQTSSTNKLVRNLFNTWSIFVELHGAERWIALIDTVGQEGLWQMVLTGVWVKADNISTVKNAGDKQRLCGALTMVLQTNKLNPEQQKAVMEAITKLKDASINRSASDIFTQKNIDQKQMEEEVVEPGANVFSQLVNGIIPDL